MAGRSIASAGTGEGANRSSSLPPGAFGSGTDYGERLLSHAQRRNHVRFDST